MSNRLEIKLFGPPQIITETGPLKFETRKAIALLAYLAIEGHEQPVSRNRLSDLLWPTTDDKKSKTNLRYTLHVLQKEVGKIHFEADRQKIRLIQTPDVAVDFLGFQQAVKAGDLSNAVNIASTQFLEGFELADTEPFEEWRIEKQTEVNRQRTAALEKIISTKNGKQPNELQKHAEQLVKIDPYNEVGYRALMQLALDAGRRNDSLKWFETCVELLHLDLGIDPHPETIRLRNNILAAGAALCSNNGDGCGHATQPNATTKSLFFGRREELRSLTQLIQSDVRLVTILGEGGVGKTRLATELCRELDHHFRDGCVMVPLVSVESIEQVIAAIANRLDLQFVNSIDPARQLVNFLKSKKLLLILDNLEHLIGTHLLDLISRLLEQTEQVSILGTSRERLKLRVEHPFRLPSLSEEPQEAQALFLDRARPYQREPHNQSQVEEICRLVGEVPLALEMAAALTATLPLNDIIYALRQNLNVLQADLHDVPTRHSSLNGVYDTSWETLSKEEQKVFAAFATFRGGGSAVAIFDITGGNISNLQSLVNKSFLNRAGDRFEVHELLRQYGAEKLQGIASIDIDQLRERHSSFFLKKYEDLLEQERSLSNWTADFENLRLAWHFYLSKKDVSNLDRVVPLLWHYFEETRRLTEAVDLFESGRNFLAAEPHMSSLYLELSYFLGVAKIRLGRNEEGVETLLSGAAAVGYPLPSTKVRQFLLVLVEFMLTRSRLIGPIWQMLQKPPPPVQIRAAQVFLQAGTVLYIHDQASLCMLTMLKGGNLTEGLPNENPIRLYALSALYVFYIITNQRRQITYLEELARSILKTAPHHPYHNAIYNSITAPNFGRKSWDTLLIDVKESLHSANGPDVEHFVGNSYTLKAILELRAGRFQDARETYDALIAHSDKNFNALEKGFAVLGYGVIDMRLGNFEKSEQHLNQVLEMMESGVELGKIQTWPYAILGVLYAKQGRWQEAEDALDEILPISQRGLPINTQSLSLIVFAAQAQLLLWKHSLLSTEFNSKSKQQTRLKHLFSLLRRAAILHPISRAEYYWLFGSFMWTRGRKRRGIRLLKRGYIAAQKYDMPFVAGQIAADLYKITESRVWFAKAKEELTKVDAIYELNKLEPEPA